MGMSAGTYAHPTVSVTISLGAQAVWQDILTLQAVAQVNK